MTDSAAFIEPLAPRLAGWPSLMRARAACSLWRRIVSFEARHRLEEGVARPDLFKFLMRTKWSRAWALHAAHRVVGRPEDSRDLLLDHAAAAGDMAWVHLICGAVDAQLTKVGCRTSAARWLRWRCGLERASSDAASSDRETTMVYFAVVLFFVALMMLMVLFSADRRAR